MRSSQQYLKCRETVLEKLKDRISCSIEALIETIDTEVTDNFIVPGRAAIDEAISDGEDVENELAEAQSTIDRLEERVAELEEQISELQAEISERSGHQ